MFYGPCAGVNGTFHIVRYPSIKVMQCGVRFTGRRIGWAYSSAPTPPQGRHLCQRCAKFAAKRA
jgi:hypothetical protein